eukprot:scaffold102342_cov72-Phaeocystis_antarctica.AAC.1
MRRPCRAPARRRPCSAARASPRSRPRCCCKARPAALRPGARAAAAAAARRSRSVRSSGRTHARGMAPCTCPTSTAPGTSHPGRRDDRRRALQLRLRPVFDCGCPAAAASLQRCWPAACWQFG